MDQQRIFYLRTYPQQLGRSCMLELSLVEQGFRKHMIHGQCLAWLEHSKRRWPLIFAHTYLQTFIERCKLGLILSGRS